MNFDGLTFLTALVLFNQLNYLNHTNKDSDWLLVACFMRVWSMLMTLFFALKIKFVLKIESDAWGIERIQYFKTNRESVAVLYSVVKHYVSCSSLHFFPALAVSCVLYSRTEHSQVFSSDLHNQDSANKMQINQTRSSMDHTLSSQKFRRIHIKYFSQTS